MLSRQQKREIWQAIVANFPLTVEGRSINPHMRYVNQAESAKLPEVVLNYPDEGHAEVEDIEGGVIQSSRLSISVYAEGYRDESGYIAAEVMAQEIARQLREWFLSKRKNAEPIGQDLYVMKVSEVRNLTSLTVVNETKARSQFDVMLSYMVVV